MSRTQPANGNNNHGAFTAVWIEHEELFFLIKNRIIYWIAFHDKVTQPHVDEQKN
jgi:hypothetical protein